jgi:metal-dependent amidase/aminoacylase/carboxypeptidase family protein
MIAEALEFKFIGETIHAARVGKGANALAAAMLCSHGIDTHRGVPGQMVNYVISSRGEGCPGLWDFPASIPGVVALRMHLRGTDAELTEDLVEKAKNCARGAALATGCTVEIRNFAPTYLDSEPIPSLNRAAKENYEKIGVNTSVAERQQRPRWRKK